MKQEPVQPLVEGVHTINDLLHMVLVVADSYWITVEVIAAGGVTIAVS
jgi:hypothetical protein